MTTFAKPVGDKRCVKCGKLWRDPVTPGPCGIRTGGTTWCDGELVEHQCGGPSEACMMKGCEECGGESLTSLAELRIERDALRARVAELEAELARIAELSPRCRRTHVARRAP